VIFKERLERSILFLFNSVPRISVLGSLYFLLRLTVVQLRDKSRRVPRRISRDLQMLDSLLKISFQFVSIAESKDMANLSARSHLKVTMSNLTCLTQNAKRMDPLFVASIVAKRVIVWETVLRNAKCFLGISLVEFASNYLERPN